jgi:hypothetical protein
MIMFYLCEIFWRSPPYPPQWGNRRGHRNGLVEWGKFNDFVFPYFPLKV